MCSKPHTHTHPRTHARTHTHTHTHKDTPWDIDFGEGLVEVQAPDGEPGKVADVSIHSIRKMDHKEVLVVFRAIKCSLAISEKSRHS